MAAIVANLDVLIVGIFCAGGLYAYLREALRLHRLLRRGRIASARVARLEIDDSGSETVKHYLVGYELVGRRGETEVHEQDLNDEKYFRRLKVGDTIDILYDADSSGNSYPAAVIRADRRLSCYVAAAILVFWAAMTVFFLELNR